MCNQGLAQTTVPQHVGDLLSSGQAMPWGLGRSVGDLAACRGWDDPSGVLTLSPRSLGPSG